MISTVEQNKKLIEKYPFLLPRNLWTDEVSKDYDYTWTLANNLPDGWYRLVLLFCKDAYSKMSEAERKKFRFSDIKEKYGTLRLNNFGANEAVCKLITLYEHYSYNVCLGCGKLSTKESAGWWIASYCDDCAEHVKSENKKLHRKYWFKTTFYYNSKKHTKHHFLFKLHHQYKKCLKLTDEQFFNYIMED